MTTVQPWIEGRVVSQRAWTKSLRSINIACDPIEFQAGQFTRLGLRVDGDVLARPYSFVNPPGEAVCEFYYVILPGGPLTMRLAELQPGDAVLVSRQPSGFLVLSEVPDVDGGGQLWLLSTGTGIGPFLSILATSTPWQRFRSVVLVHGVRHLPELVYGERIAALQSGQGERFRYIPLLTRDAIAQRPGALAGRIPEALRSGSLERAAGGVISAQSSQVMLCGNPAMVSETVDVLKGRGMKKHRRRDPGQITVENYW